MNQKVPIVPQRQRNPNSGQNSIGGLAGDLSYSIDAQIAQMQGADDHQDSDSDNLSNIQFIYNNVVISEEKRNFLKTKFNINDI